MMPFWGSAGTRISSEDTGEAGRRPPGTRRAGRAQAWFSGNAFIDRGQLRDARFRAVAPLLLLFGLGAGAWIVWLTRRYDYFADEWDFVLGVPNWSVGDYFIPHNEHWSTIPALIYRLLLQVVGTHSYVPYMLVLMALHVLTAMLLFLLIRRRSGDLPALAAAMILLVLGQGWEDLLWAFQIGFVGACAMGLLAVLLLTSQTMPVWQGIIGALATLAALMMSGPGLVFLVVVAVAIFMEGEQRRRLLYLIAPTIILIVWYVTVGHRGVAETNLGSGSSTFSLSVLRQMVRSVPLGIGTASAGLIGVTYQWSSLCLIALGVIVGAGWARFRPSPVAIAAGVGVVAQYVLIVLVGHSLGDLVTTASRYVYIAAVLLLIILAEIAGRLPWRLSLVPVAAAALLVVVGFNAWTLDRASVSHYQSDIAPGQVSQQVAWTYRDAPSLDRNAPVDDSVMPTAPVRSYLQNRESNGSPLPSLTPAEVGRLPGRLVDRAMTHLLPLRAAAAPAAGPPSACVPFPTGGLRVGAGKTVVLRSTEAGAVNLYASHYAAPSATPAATVTLASSQDEVVVQTPSVGTQFTWQIGATGPPGGEMLLCPS